MGNFRENRRGGFGGRNRSSGGRFGGRSSGGFGGRDRDNRRPLDMHDVVCDKCGKNCQVPFKPTGDKPVYCSDCFRQNEGSSGRGSSSGSGMSSEQFEKLNAKLDKIIAFLETIEVEEVDDEDVSDEDEEETEEVA
jgi:CxxC-x17-CxxC domain-containing protein